MTQLEETFDHVVVGSGAAGATAARVLVDSGRSVAIVEEGPRVPTAEFRPDLYESALALYRDAGGRIARGRSYIPVLQGSCFGGSTVVNSGIVRRIPEDVWQQWRDDFGLGDALPYAALVDNWERIEEDLRVTPTQREVWGNNNGLLSLAAERAGVSGGPTHRNAPACKGSARCQLGCPHGAKLSMALTYLPYAEQHRAAVFTDTRVVSMAWKGDRVTTVRGTRSGGAPFELGVRRSVVVAASAVETPCLLWRSGIRSKHLGRHLQAHPGPSITGLFDERVGQWSGATQGFEVDEHRRNGRFKVESVALPLETFLAITPGVGRRWLDNMSHAAQTATWAIQSRTYAEGTVTDTARGPSISYRLEARDIDIIRKGLAFAAELLFAVGARAVITGVHGLPETLTSPDQVALLASGPSDPAAYQLAISHLFGTARMAERPTDGVVGLDFRVHGSENLYVVDSSVFPTNLGVNPQHPIMGVAMLAAKRIGEAA